MSKVNFTFELTDEMFDDAAKQLINSCVRQAVSAELDRQLNDRIEEIVATKTRQLINTLESKYSWGSTSEYKKKLEQAIIEKLAEIRVEDVCNAKVNRIVSSVKEHADTQINKVDTYVSDAIALVDKHFAKNVRQNAESILKESLGPMFAKLLESIPIEYHSGGNCDD